MSFTPYDSSAPSHTSPPPRPVYNQPVYGAYDQPAYGHMGYADMPQSGQRYNPAMQNVQGYPSATSATPGSGPYPNQQDMYTGPSFSPTSSHFAPQIQDQYTPESDPNAMTYTASRRRYQSTSGVLPSDSRYPMPRRTSAESHMPMVNEGYDYVPSQAPSLGYPPEEADSHMLRHASVRSSSTGHSLTTSALALEKPYECDICHTRFARHHDCRRHRETHAVNASGEKPHHCVVCGKSFTRKDALKRHSNQKGCDISMAPANFGSSSHSSSSASPQQSGATFYPVASLPHGSGSSSQFY
ncbi:hypothetical protein BDV93DRAFT_520973 [Ceratobasidium sp. AG-I]|nr:hypothetical protein BDV93DRAFT_520973 [Ceratobasidium sp. AG-I]